jgi:hypothetical protein
MKQSAVKQLLEEVILERKKSISVEFREALDFVITAIQTDYKEMEKQQIIDAYDNAYIDRYYYNSRNGKQYYNEQFKNK